jgi:hypothetical protein
MVCGNICETMYSKKIVLVKAITMMVRNTVEGVRYTYTMMDCFVHGLECSTPSSRKCKEMLRKRKRVL